MRGILKTIFGSGEVIKRGMDLIDDMHTSKEEEIAAKNKARTDLLAAYAPFKIAQRLIGLLFTSAFLLGFLLVMGMTLSGTGNPDDVKMVLSEFWIGEIMLTIVAFYFGGGAFEGFAKARK